MKADDVDCWCVDEDLCVFATNSKQNHTLCGSSAPKEERASIVAFVCAFLKEEHVGTKVANIIFLYTVEELRL